MKFNSIRAKSQSAASSSFCSFPRTPRASSRVVKPRGGVARGRTVFISTAVVVVVFVVFVVVFGESVPRELVDVGASRDDAVIPVGAKLMHEGDRHRRRERADEKRER